MKFRSRRDNTFKLIFLGISMLFALLIGESFLFVDFSVDYIIVFDSIMAVLWLFVIWIFLDTSYEISDKEITIRSGPVFKSIPLDKINKVIIGRTAWQGIKFALARNGLVIKYKGGKEVYISPRTNETFVEELKNKNPPIEIEYYEHQWLK
jgi:hypothetical protein